MTTQDIYNYLVSLKHPLVVQMATQQNPNGELRGSIQDISQLGAASSTSTSVQ